MSVAADGSSASTLDIKQHFVTREGYYRNLSAFEYSRPNRATQVSALSSAQQPNVPVKISLVQVPDDDTGYPDRILFNVGRELFLYTFKSIWETPDLSRPIDRQIHKALPTCHDINTVNCSAQGLSVLVGFTTGSFQLNDVKKEVHVFNEDRLLDKTKVTCIKWVPGSVQQFLVGFQSGQLFHCDDTLPWMTAPPTYQLHKHGEGYAVYTCKSRTARNPAYRWMIGEGSLNAFAFSPCAKYLATVSHDGCLRVFVFDTMDLLGTAKSYFGGLLCLCWSPDSKFICCAGEDDLVHLFSTDNRKMVARGRGHRSWVTAVSFDPMTSCLTHDVVEKVLNNNISSNNNNNNVRGNLLRRDVTAAPLSPPVVSQRITTYRFASVGQDTQVCLWELTDDIVKQSVSTKLRAGSIMHSTAPLIAGVNSSAFPALTAALPFPKSTKSEQNNHRRNISLLGGRLTEKAAGSSSHTKNNSNSSSGATSAASQQRDDPGKNPVAPLSPKLDDVPLLEPLVCKRIAAERLNDIVFHDDCILISTQEGIIMTWSRPGRVPPNNSSRQNSCSN